MVMGRCLLIRVIRQFHGKCILLCVSFGMLGRRALAGGYVLVDVGLLASGQLGLRSCRCVNLCMLVQTLDDAFPWLE